MQTSKLTEKLGPDPRRMTVEDLCYVLGFERKPLNDLAKMTIAWRKDYRLKFDNEIKYGVDFVMHDYPQGRAFLTQMAYDFVTKHGHSLWPLNPSRRELKYQQHLLPPFEYPDDELKIINYVKHLMHKQNKNFQQNVAAGMAKDIERKKIEPLIVKLSLPNIFGRNRTNDPQSSHSRGNDTRSRLEKFARHTGKEFEGEARNFVSTSFPSSSSAMRPSSTIISTESSSKRRRIMTKSPQENLRSNGHSDDRSEDETSEPTRYGDHDSDYNENDGSEDETQKRIDSKISPTTRAKSARRSLGADLRIRLRRPQVGEHVQSPSVNTARGATPGSQTSQVYSETTQQTVEEILRESSLAKASQQNTTSSQSTNSQPLREQVSINYYVKWVLPTKNTRLWTTTLQGKSLQAVFDEVSALSKRDNICEILFRMKSVYKGALVYAIKRDETNAYEAMKRHLSKAIMSDHGTRAVNNFQVTLRLNPNEKAREIEVISLVDDELDVL